MSRHDLLVAYRCTTCGKWSHAKKKPKKHLRFVQEHGPEPKPDPSVMINYDPGDNVAGSGWNTWCGPFETYDLVRREEHA